MEKYFCPIFHSNGTTSCKINQPKNYQKCCIAAYSYITETYSNTLTNFNERRNTLFIKIHFSHFILERVDVGCVWEVSWWRGHCSTSTEFWLGCSIVGNWGPKALCLPLALNSASFPQLAPTATGTETLTNPSRLWYLLLVGIRICHHHRIQPRPQVKVIFRYLRPDAPVSLFFRLFTQVHLLIDGSVEGQYVTKAF